MVENNFLTSLIAGGTAGLLVDVSLFPIDTIKTRLQSSQGFFKAGGFHNIYKGILPQAIGSVPTAALFFCTYDGFKNLILPQVPKSYHSLVYMIGASVGETVACLIRVPVEVVKQRRQTSIGRTTSTHIFLEAYRSEGIIKGLYRGFFSTVFREIPFSLIQFPIWESFKVIWSENLTDRTLTSFESAICGAFAGGIAAFLTTPLDVVKTRIMLADRNLETDLRILVMAKKVYRENSLTGLYAGCIPRTLWITLGGFIFFGTYEFTKEFLNSL